jgi:hypothetical protein
MPTTYSSNLKITLIGDGEQTNVWGGTTNTNLGTLLEQAITGVSGVGSGNTAITMTGSADYVLTNNDGAVNQARNAVLIVNGASSGGYAVVTPAGQQKVYIVNNKLTTGAVIVKPSGGTGVSVPNATTMILYTDGTTTQAVNYAPPASTATSLAGGTANAIPYQSGPDSTVFLASVSGDAGKVLTSNGTSAPSWTTVSGGGGTANAIVGGSAGQVLYQSGTSATNFTATGSSGQILKSNGTSPPSWSSSIPTDGANTWTGLNVFVNNGSGNGTPIYGSTNGLGAFAGYVGQLVSSTGTNTGGSGSDIVLTTITLTPGDWDINGQVSCNPSTNILAFNGGVNVTTSISGSTGFYLNGGGTFGPISLPIPYTPTNISATTTIYLLGRVSVSGGGSVTMNGAVYARRIR